jgi:hypothetical protein
VEGGVEQFHSQQLGVASVESTSGLKNTGFVFAARVFWIEAILDKLYQLNDGVLGIGELHES